MDLTILIHNICDSYPHVEDTSWCWPMGQGGHSFGEQAIWRKSSILTVQNKNTENKTGHLRVRGPGTCPAPRQRHSWQSEEVNTSLLACLQHHIVKIVKVPAPPLYKLSSSVIEILLRQQATATFFGRRSKDTPGEQHIELHRKGNHQDKSRIQEVHWGLGRNCSCSFPPESLFGMFFGLGWWWEPLSKVCSIPIVQAACQCSCANGLGWSEHIGHWSSSQGIAWPLLSHQSWQGRPLLSVRRCPTPCSIEDRPGCSWS